jgi:hypothetical protein
MSIQVILKTKNLEKIYNIANNSQINWLIKINNNSIRK